MTSKEFKQLEMRKAISSLNGAAMRLTGLGLWGLADEAQALAKHVAEIEKSEALRIEG